MTQYQIAYQDITAETIGAVLYVMLKDNVTLSTDMSLSEARSALTAALDDTLTRNEIADIAAGMDKEYTSRICFTKPESIQAIYKALAPEVASAESLVVTLRIKGELPYDTTLMDLPAYAGRVMIVQFLRKHRDTLLKQVFDYDADSLKTSLKHDPDNFILYVSDNVSCCAGYPEYA